MERIHIQRNMPVCLHRVRVEQDPVLLCQRADLPERLYRTDLVVRRHDCDQDGIGSDRRLQLIKLYHAARIHVHIRDLISLLLQILAGMQHRVVLDLRSYDMFSFFLAERCRRFDCPVIRLASAGCKINFIVLCTDQLRNTPSRLIHRLHGSSRKGVDAGRVCILFAEIGFHRLKHFLGDPGRRRVIKIDHFLFLIAFPKS